MFTIQYTTFDGSHKMQEVDTNQRRRLLQVLAHYERPIIAVYEQASPITKQIRKELEAYPGDKSRSAQDFINSLR